MPSKRFRTRRQWLNTSLWGMFTVGVSLVAVALSAMTGDLLYVQVTAAITLTGMAIAIWSDTPAGVSYVIDGNNLMLKRRGEVQTIEMELINDASLLDRRAARDMVLARIAGASKTGSKAERLKLKRECTKWCTVDIGMNSLTFGIGRDMIDRRPDAKHDLVVLRLRDGRILVLSPVYNQDMVESLNRHVSPVHESRRR